MKETYDSIIAKVQREGYRESAERSRREHFEREGGRWGIGLIAVFFFGAVALLILALK